MWGIPDYNHEAPKYEPKWERMVDYSPDHNPSVSRVVTMPIGSRLIRVYQVRGLGVLLQDATQEKSKDGRLTFRGLALLTKDEIGYAPDL